MTTIVLVLTLVGAAPKVSGSASMTLTASNAVEVTAQVRAAKAVGPVEIGVDASISLASMSNTVRSGISLTAATLRVQISAEVTQTAGKALEVGFSGQVQLSLTENLSVVASVAGNTNGVEATTKVRYGNDHVAASAAVSSRGSGTFAVEFSFP